MNILFWNLNNNPLHFQVRKCILEMDVDIAIFAEHHATEFEKVVKNTCYQRIEGFGGCSKIVAISKSPVKMAVKQEQSRYILYEVEFHEEKYAVAGIHLQDRRSADESIRLETIRRLKADIHKLEVNIRTNNTIIIGDFNSNPYDRELLQMDAFDAVLFKKIINHAETHTVNGIKRRRFYNPVLHFICEDTENYGSFYYDNGSYSPIWHCLDQILLSKTLSSRINDMKYLKSIGRTSLMNTVKPKASISDHLPLYVRIN